jgi:asparagine synthase (glutamine-hydrolysing)
VFDDTAITFYRHILRLPPAHSVTVIPEGARLQTYWSLDPAHELRLGSDEAYAETFRELFTEAVRCRLRTAFPLGSLLSGGLDSSSVTCVARQELARDGGHRLHTFSAIFDEIPECDERPFIRAVIAQDGLESHYVHGDQLSPLTDLDRVLWHQDEAFYAPNLCLNWGLYVAARQQGVRVLLDGFDGDTTVSHGIGYLDELARAGRWFTLVREIRGYTRNFDLSFRKLLKYHAWRYGLAPMIARSRPLRLARRVWRAAPWRSPRRGHQSADRSVPGTTLHPDFVQRIGLAQRCQALQHARSVPPRTEREQHYRTLIWGVMPFTLEVLDRAAAAFGIEPRFPFWDKRLVEFCLALPPEQKVQRGWTRMVLRRAMTGVLPVEVQWRRRKSNLGPSFHHGLLTYERARLEEMILRNPGIIEKYVDIAALRQAYHRFVLRETTEDAMEIWKAVSLGLWLQHTGLTP